MIRASYPTVVGKPGVFALYIAEGPKASDYKQGRLISVRSGLNRQGRGDGASAEPFGFRREFRPGRGQSATLTALKPTSPSTTGHRRDRAIGPDTVSVQISRAASISPCGCAITQQTAPTNGLQKRPLRPQTPE